MSTRANKTERTFCYYKRNSSNRVTGNKGFIGKLRFVLPQRSGFSPFRLLNHFAEKVARVVCMVSERRPDREDFGSGRSKNSSVPPVDSQRVEAVEDCIKFINSSSTLSRSNSTTQSS